MPSSIRERQSTFAMPGSFLMGRPPMMQFSVTLPSLAVRKMDEYLRWNGMNACGKRLSPAALPRSTRFHHRRLPKHSGAYEKAFVLQDFPPFPIAFAFLPFARTVTGHGASF